MPMMMSDEEIRTSYRDARHKDAQIRILAELNDCPRSSILAILHAGEATGRASLDRAVALYKSGMTSREAAEITGEDVYRLRYYLHKFKIKRRKQT